MLLLIIKIVCYFDETIQEQYGKQRKQFFQVLMLEEERFE